jgi:hypothetical protein
MRILDKICSITCWFKYFTLNLKDNDHLIRVIFGALAASSLAASLALASIEHIEEKCFLRYAAYLFSVDIIPLAVISACSWPEPIATSKLGYKWRFCIPFAVIVFASILAFIFGVGCLILNFYGVAWSFPIMGVFLYLLVIVILTANKRTKKSM